MYVDAWNRKIIIIITNRKNWVGDEFMVPI